MGRPVKEKLDYFPLDVDFFEDPKLLMIEEDHGIKGCYVAVRLMAMVYKEGYFLKWVETSSFSTAKKLGKEYTSNDVEEILKSCLKHDLFDSEKFQEYGILTSRGIQKRWLFVMNSLRRKVEVNVVYDCISVQKHGVNVQKPPVSSEETPLSTTLMRQKKGKERKGKESITPADSPQVHKKPKKVSTKKNEDSEPYWQKLVDEWFFMNQKIFGAPPSFTGKDARELKKLIGLLKARAKLKQVEWTESIAIQRFTAFMEEAYKDQWISKNFLLNNLVSQFDKIILNHSQHGAANRKNSTGTIIPITGGKSAGATELIERLKNTLITTGNA